MARSREASSRKSVWAPSGAESLLRNGGGPSCWSAPPSVRPNGIRSRTNYHARLSRVSHSNRCVVRDSLGVVKGRSGVFRAGALLAGCTAAYLWFHLYRTDLPPSVLRDSFPSFLLPVVIFATVDLRRRIRFPDLRVKLTVFVVTLIAAVAWFEAIVPGILGHGTADLQDSLAMALGFVAYVIVSACPRFRGGFLFGATAPKT
jgi:hypothetical protein